MKLLIFIVVVQLVIELRTESVGIMHSERYSDYSDADIDRIYGPKEALHSSAQFIAENGKETLAQVFADVRYPESLIKSIAAAISPIINK